jgi:hypothetical protein
MNNVRVGSWVSGCLWLGLLLSLGCMVGVLSAAVTPPPVEARPQPLSEETLERFHRELEASLRVQHDKELSVLAEHGEALGRIEGTLAVLGKQLTAVAAQQVVPKVEAKAAAKPEAKVVAKPEVKTTPQAVTRVVTSAPVRTVVASVPVRTTVTYSLPPDVFESPSRSYSSVPATSQPRRGFARQVFRGDCLNGVCPR